MRNFEKMCNEIILKKQVDEGHLCKLYIGDKSKDRLEKYKN